VIDKQPYDATRKPRTDAGLTVEWVEQRMRPGMLIEEDDGVLRPIGNVEANLINTKYRKVDNENPEG
jgi:hypothetical protein